jgi:aminobenzoyl-glutamate utilization protein B
VQDSRESCREKDRARRKNRLQVSGKQKARSEMAGPFYLLYAVFPTRLPGSVPGAGGAVKPLAVITVCLLLSRGTLPVRGQRYRHPARRGADRRVPDSNKAAAFAWIDANGSTIDNLALEIWNEPELSFREFKSSRSLMRYLESNGFAIEKNAGGMPTAFVASYGSGSPVIAFWTEEDALAAMSQKPLPMREPITAGAPGHACGHNLIGSSTVAAAVAVADFLKRTGTKGTIRVYGTPAEEAGGGKEFLLEAGLFKDVDVLLGWHPSSDTRTEFEYTKAAAELHFHFKGVAAHSGVAPWVGRSALHAVELMDAGVNYMREQMKEDARITYVISNGGGQPNVIPADAESWYSIRANKHDEVAGIVQWVSEIARAAAMMTRTEVEVRVDNDMPEVLPNRPLAEAIERNLQLVGTPRFTENDAAIASKILDATKRTAQPVKAEVVPLPEAPTQESYSTDLGNVSWKVPTERLAVNSAPYALGAHTWQAVVLSATTGLKAMPIAAKALAGTAIDLFTDPALREAARRDFEVRTKGNSFTLLTPPNRKPPIYSEEQNGAGLHPASQ